MNGKPKRVRMLKPTSYHEVLDVLRWCTLWQTTSVANSKCKNILGAGSYYKKQICNNFMRNNIFPTCRLLDNPLTQNTGSCKVCLSKQTWKSTVESWDLCGLLLGFLLIWTHSVDLQASQPPPYSWLSTSSSTDHLAGRSRENWPHRKLITIGYNFYIWHVLVCDVQMLFDATSITIRLILIVRIVSQLSPEAEDILARRYQSSTNKCSKCHKCATVCPAS